MIIQTGHYRIKMISPDGILSTIAGTGVTGNSGNGGSATIATITPIGSQIVTDTFGNIYFCDSFQSVRKIAWGTGIISRVAGTGDHIGNPYTGDGLLATNSHISPFAVFADDTGNLFICDGVNARIEKVNSTGYIYTIAGNGIQGFSGDNGPATTAEIQTPEYVVLDKCNNVYIGDFGNQRRIREVTYDSTCKYTNAKVPEIPSTELKIYPNPVLETLYIDNVRTNARYSLFNITGITITKGTLAGGSNVISLAGLAAGVYVVKIWDSDGVETVRRVVKW